MKMPALILNDYHENTYATWVKWGVKKIETRMNRAFKFRGDIIICCGKTNSVTDNAGKALCIVNIWKVRDMVKSDESAACIEYHAQKKCLLLKDWRHFNYDFEFSKYATKKNFQGIFEIELPKDVIIIPKLEITPFKEKENFANDYRLF